MVSAVAALDSKVNLKKFFTELPLNEDGCFVVNQVGLKFKTLQTEPPLSPTEYVPLLKALDKDRKGLIQVRDLLKSLELYSASYDSDIQLELKYMANFVEFQMNNRNTKTFFV